MKHARYRIKMTNTWVEFVCLKVKYLWTDWVHILKELISYTLSGKKKHSQDYIKNKKTSETIWIPIWLWLLTTKLTHDYPLCILFWKITHFNTVNCFLRGSLLLWILVCSKINFKINLVLAGLVVTPIRTFSSRAFSLPSPSTPSLWKALLLPY